MIALIPVLISRETYKVAGSINVIEMFPSFFDREPGRPGCLDSEALVCTLDGG